MFVQDRIESAIETINRTCDTIAGFRKKNTAGMVESLGKFVKSKSSYSSPRFGHSNDFMLFAFLAIKNSEKYSESTYLLGLRRMCLNPHFVLVTRLAVSQWQLQPMDWHWGSCWALLRWSPPATGGAHSLRRREPGVFYQSRAENQELLSVFQVSVLLSVEQLELKILKDKLCQK